MHRLGAETRLGLYRAMRVNRLVEERLVNLYRQGRIVGGLYRSLGQEATSVGTAAALREGDYIGPLIRNLGSVLVRGVRPRDVFAQYLARRSSPTGGKDGTLHFVDRRHGVVGAIAMLGELVPVMAGIALAMKMRGESSVCMTYIGDGGTSTGPFHEGMNFASVQKLPLVVVGENNHWAYSTPLSRQMNVPRLADRAAAYGVPAVTVDGNDVESVYEAAFEAVERARSGGGATFVEAITYRMKGHAEHDGQHYVDPEELERWRGRDPLDRQERRLIADAVADPARLRAIDAAAASEVEAELSAAESAGPPDPASALDGVYAGRGRPEAVPSIVRLAERRFP